MTKTFLFLYVYHLSSIEHCSELDLATISFNVHEIRPQRGNTRLTFLDSPTVTAGSSLEHTVKNTLDSRRPLEMPDSIRTRSTLSFTRFHPNLSLTNLLLLNPRILRPTTHRLKTPAPAPRILQHLGPHSRLGLYTIHNGNINTKHPAMIPLPILRQILNHFDRMTTTLRRDSVVVNFREESKRHRDRFVATHRCLERGAECARRQSEESSCVAAVVWTREHEVDGGFIREGVVDAELGAGCWRRVY